MLRADTLHSATDVFSVLVVWVGIRIAGRSSRNFPYGLYEVGKLVVLSGKGPGFVLGNAGVITRLADTEDAEAVLEEIRRDCRENRFSRCPVGDCQAGVAHVVYVAEIVASYYLVFI